MHTGIVGRGVERHGETRKPTPSRRRAPKERSDKYFARLPRGRVVELRYGLMNPKMSDNERC